MSIERLERGRREGGEGSRKSESRGRRNAGLGADQCMNGRVGGRKFMLKDRKYTLKATLPRSAGACTCCSSHRSSSESTAGT